MGDSYVGGRKHAKDENYTRFFIDYWCGNLPFYILHNHSRHHHKQQCDDFSLVSLPKTEIWS